MNKDHQSEQASYTEHLTLPTAGNIYVTDTGPYGSDPNTRVYVFDADGNQMLTLEGTDATPAFLNAFDVAVDDAGNIYVTDNFTFTIYKFCGIQAFDFAGFFDPVENPPTVNSVKAGRAVPIKFSLNGDQGLDIFAEGYPISRPTDCATLPVGEAVETVTAGGSTLSYDPATDQYTYVWKTSKSWSGCRELDVQLTDGTSHEVLFDFK